MYWLLPSNPLMVRESRERWRRPLSIVWVFVYASCLALAGYLLYRQFVPADFATQTRFIGAGKQLFAWIGAIQLISWIVLGLLIGAPALSIERQRRSLIEYFLAGLTPEQIIAAKWRAIAGFALVVMLAPLPVMSLCFVLGGVTPLQFIAFALALVAVGFSSCACGLLISVERRTVSSALGDATLCAAGLLLPAGVIVLPLPSTPPLFTFCVAVAITTSCSFFLTQTRAKLRSISQQLGEELLPSLRFEARITFEDETNDPETNDAEADEFIPITGITVLSADVDDYDNEGEDIALPTLIGGAFAPPPPIEKVEVEVVGRFPIALSEWESQLENLTRHNPVAWKQWRAYLQTTERFTTKRKHTYPGTTAFIIGVLGLGANYFWQTEVVWRTVGLGLMAACSGLIISQLAPSFNREREEGTLAPLLLTALSPQDIVFGKLLGASLAAMRLTFWPLVALCIAGLAFGPSVALGMLAIIVAQFCFSGALAAYFSLVCRQASVASGATWGACILLWLLPLLFATFFPWLSWPWLDWLYFLSFHNFLSPSGASAVEMIGAALLLFLLTGFVSWITRRQVGRTVYGS